MPREISSTGQHSGSGSGRGASASPELRASHEDRDRTVDVLRVAAGDGRLTLDELDERLEVALSARTLGELAALTADLPSASPGGAAAAEVKDVLRIHQKHSTITRAGRWVVPRRMELIAEWCEVTLDFTEAVITQDTLRIDVDSQGKTLTLVTRPGIVVDVDGLALEHSRFRIRRTPDAAPGAPVLLRVELVGRKSFGRVVVRPPRRTFGQWLLRRPPALPAGH
ncbi:DUF1707 domain-containing protein [Streptomyces sp. NBC_01255]|uniref:DUF1707 SHOCT-like domain-containing protein n=1 Tax=Streptomyces sp. NBC_01255 TaxID=2903798 RepID=UPI002E31EAA6|nr:DUF1707 domain-containing protein [Streptomyces sp. NBC_01255]